MKEYQKHLVMFIVQSILFILVMLLFDWIGDELKLWYHYLLQGLLFGFFVTLYFYWVDKRKKNRNKKEEP